MGTVDSGERHSNVAHEPQLSGDSRWRVPAWAIGWIVLALLLSTIPYVAGLVNTPSGSTFTGSLLNSMDTFSYYGKMQLGQQGKWCFELFYSADSGGECGPFFWLHIALGQVAGLTGLSIPLVYHGARVISGALLGVAMLQLAVRTLSAEREQRLVLALVLFTGGWGWLVILVAGVDIDRNLIMDLWRFEANGPGTLAGFPHFALVVACQIWLVLAGLSLFEIGRSWQMILVAVLSALGVALIHPQQLAIPGVILGVAALQNVLNTHHSWRSPAAIKDAMQHGVLLIAIFLAAALVALAQWIVIQREPDFQAWLEAGVPGSVPLIGVLSLFGPIMPLALLGVWCVWRMRDARLYPVVIWLALQLVLLQLPLDVSSRYAEGLYIPIAILAAVGWFRGVAPWLSRYAPRRVAKAALPVVFASVAISAIFLLTMMLVRIMNHDNPDYYISADDRAAFAWLDDVATLDDAVLSEENVGNRLPAFAGVRVLVGHGYETLDFEDRADEVRWFFDASTADAARIAYLRRFGIDYVYVSPVERALGEFDPAAAPYLAAGFTQGAVTVYVVDLPPENG